jgi:hypothetical protein
MSKKIHNKHWIFTDSHLFMFDCCATGWMLGRMTGLTTPADGLL